ncbi:MAG TPA: hypothetical protein GX713_01820 [Mollicutes bacterium]|nr:hypothetical protein [Mollicutes bacterium]
MREIISSIDVGGNKIKLVVGEFYENEFNILCAVEEPTRGFIDHEITNENELIKAIKRVLNKASLKLNFKIKKVIVNIPTSYNNFVISEATEKIDNEESKVTSKCILKVIQNTTKNQININEELIAAIPVYFRVADEETKEPFNKRGKSILAKTVLVTGSKIEVYSLIGALEKCGLEVIDIASPGLVDYYNFKNESLDKDVGIIVNIGHYKTHVSVINKGIYINNDVIPVGGANIDNDIAFMYKLRRGDAKYLKENLALAHTRRANPKETKEILNKEGETLVINQYELSEIVASRVTEMLKLIKTSINHLTKKEISYIIITGGLSELKDFNIAVSTLFGETAQIGRINNLGARDNKYSTGVGMIKYFKSKLILRHREYQSVSDENIEAMLESATKSKIVASDSILGKVFGYFFDS